MELTRAHRPGDDEAMTGRGGSDPVEAAVEEGVAMARLRWRCDEGDSATT